MYLYTSCAYLSVITAHFPLIKTWLARIMKNLVFILLFSGCALCSSAQKPLTGLWTGTISNDSTTVRHDQSFEIALTQYKEKVYGYSRRTFIVNDTLYYVLKRVKGKVDGDVCEVSDDEYISFNFPGRVDKGVKVTYIFRLNQQDSTWSLDGRWHTNKVKKNFYAISGDVSMREEKNLDNSKLFSHLEELKLDHDVAFYAEAKAPVKTPAPATATPAPPQKDIASNKKTTEKPAKTTNDKPAGNNSIAKETEKKTKKNAVEETNTARTQAPQQNSKTGTDKPAITPVLPAAIVAVPPAAQVKERTSPPPQIVTFSSDSLLLSLYDNGEVDGDTVSVLLNGEVIMPKQGLKATAIKKTIYISPDQQEISLLLYAENLGRYPPNTGLLVVRDGEETYQLRFSADLHQNAVIVFRRKNK